MISIYKMTVAMNIIFILPLFNYLITNVHSINNIEIVSNNYQCTGLGKDLANIENSKVSEIYMLVSLCEGLVHCMDSGPGGGFQGIYFSEKRNESTYLLAREQSPMDKNFLLKERICGNSVGVPSMLYGYYELFKTDDNLKVNLREVLEPLKRLANSGFFISQTLKNIGPYLPNIRSFMHFDDYYNIVVNKAFGTFIEYLQINGIEALKKPYEDPNFNWIRENMLIGAKKYGSLLTRSDFLSYKPKLKSTIKITDLKFRKRDLIAVGMSNPSGGMSILYALKLMNILNKKINKTEDNKYRILVELLYNVYSFKNYAPCMTDKYFKNFLDNNAEIIANNILQQARENPLITNEWHSGQIKRKFGTIIFPRVIYRKNDKGTSNVIVRKNGVTFISTASINHSFGSKIYLNDLGFFLNNQLRDFAFENYDYVEDENFYKFPNKAAVSKIPQSSMGATLIVNSQGKVVMGVGAAGGMKITGAIINVLWNYLIEGLTLENAIYAPRTIIFFHARDKKIEIMYEYLSTSKKSQSDIKIYCPMTNVHENCTIDHFVTPSTNTEKLVYLSTIKEAGYSAVTAFSSINKNNIMKLAFDPRRGGSYYKKTRRES